MPSRYLSAAVFTTLLATPLAADLLTVSGSGYTDWGGELVYDGTEANEYADGDSLGWELDMLEMTDWDGSSPFSATTSGSFAVGGASLAVSTGVTASLSTTGSDATFSFGQTWSGTPSNADNSADESSGEYTFTFELAEAMTLTWSFSDDDAALNGMIDWVGDGSAVDNVEGNTYDLDGGYTIQPSFEFDSISLDAGTHTFTVSPYIVMGYDAPTTYAGGFDLVFTSPAVVPGPAAIAGLVVAGLLRRRQR